MSKVRTEQIEEEILEREPGNTNDVIPIQSAKVLLSSVTEPLNETPTNDDKFLKADPPIVNPAGIVAVKGGMTAVFLSVLILNSVPDSSNSGINDKFSFNNSFTLCQVRVVPEEGVNTILIGGICAFTFTAQRSPTATIITASFCEKLVKTLSVLLCEKRNVFIKKPI